MIIFLLLNYCKRQMFGSDYVKIIISFLLPFFISISAVGKEITVYDGALRVFFQEPAEATAPEWPSALSPTTKVELILDASNSMWGQIESTAKIAIAKEVLTSVIESLPPNASVALRVYGHQTSHKAKNCSDSALLVPFGPLDKEKLISEIEGISPRGMTPIAYSLLQVKDDFGETTGKQLVVLVSDGKESCEGDPVGAVRSLREQGIDIQVEVVGFAIADEETKRQLSQIAELTGGKYYEASDASQLKSALAESLKLVYFVEDEGGDKVSQGIVGGERVCLPTGTYKVTLTSGEQSFTSPEISIQQDLETQLMVIAEGEEHEWQTKSEEISNPCPPRLVTVADKPPAVDTTGPLFRVSIPDPDSVSGKSIGYIDSTGKEVIKPQFISAGEFKEGLAPADIGDKAGFIDRTGKMVFEVVMKSYSLGADHFPEGVAAVRINGKQGYIDRTGKVVIEPKFDYYDGIYSDRVNEFSEGLAAVKNGNKWGYIDQTGKVVIEPKFDIALPFSEGLAVVMIGDKIGCYN